MTLDTNALEEQVRSAAKGLGEPEFFIQRRLHAVESMGQLQMPKMQEFSYDGWPILPASDQVRLAAISPSKQAVAAAHQAVGKDVYLQSAAHGQVETSQPVPTGIVVEPLQQALVHHAETIKRYFMSVINAGQDKLTAYHQAAVNSGSLIEVTAGTAVDKPIEIMEVQDATKADQPLVNHLLVVAHPHSKVSIVQHLASVGGQANLANLMVEIIAEPGSEVHFAVLDETGANITTYLNRRAKIDRDAQVEWAVGMMNGGNVLGDMDAELVGEGSKVDSKLIAVTGGHQHVGLNNRVTNRGPHSTGLINQRGVVLDSSELIFNGIGQIIHGAHGSEAEQQNRLLMMSPQARGDANPILLIDENDVNAGHAASVGQVDAQQLYYLLSRGIPEHLAKRMVIRGFLSAVLTALPNRQLEDEMIAILERKLLSE